MGGVGVALVDAEDVARLQPHRLFDAVAAVVHVHLAVHHGEDFLAVVDVPAVGLVGPVQAHSGVLHGGDQVGAPGAPGAVVLAAHDPHAWFQSYSICSAVRAASSWPASRATRCSDMSMPAEMPPLVTMRPLSIQRRSPVTVTRGKAARSSARSSQWVVTCWPSSSPACASRKAPVHTDATSSQAGAVAAIQRITSCLSCSAATTPPGTISTSSWPALPKSASGNTLRPARARSMALRWPMVRTRNGAADPGASLAAIRVAQVNTSYGPAKSSTSTSSNT